MFENYVEKKELRGVPFFRCGLNELELPSGENIETDFEGDEIISLFR